VHGGCDYFEILYSIMLRARRVQNGVGHIAVVRRESYPALNKYRNRLYTGITDLSAGLIPQEIQAELRAGVPDKLCGVSVLMFPRPIRYLCRHGLGLIDIDLKNAFFSSIELILKDAVSQMSVPAVVANYVRDREWMLDTMSRVMTEKRVKKHDDEEADTLIRVMTRKPQRIFTRDDMKELIIRMGFGGTLHGWMQENMADLDCEVEETDDAWGKTMVWLRTFEAGMQRVRAELCRILKAAAVDHKLPDMNSGAMSFHVYVNTERRLLDMMAAAIQGANGQAPRWVEQ
jgi:hypothetical protein